MANVDWNRQVEDLGPSLYRYFCAQFAGVEASDLVQDTLIRLLRKVDQGEYDPARGSLRMYAFGIAHYVRLEAVKSRREEPIEFREADTAFEDSTVDRLARARRGRCVGPSQRYRRPNRAFFFCYSMTS
jgi:DNA-directed RNA polymerase specialized sigma24 family protein